MYSPFSTNPIEISTISSSLARHETVSKLNAILFFGMFSYLRESKLNSFVKVYRGRQKVPCRMVSLIVSFRFLSFAKVSTLWLAPSIVLCSKQSKSIDYSKQYKSLLPGLLMELLIEISLQTLKFDIVGLLPPGIVLQTQFDGVSDFDFLADEAQRQLQNLHIVGNESEIVIAHAADVVGLLIKRFGGVGGWNLLAALSLERIRTFVAVGQRSTAHGRFHAELIQLVFAVIILKLLFLSHHTDFTTKSYITRILMLLQLMMPKCSLIFNCWAVGRHFDCDRLIISQELCLKFGDVCQIYKDFGKMTKVKGEKNDGEWNWKEVGTCLVGDSANLVHSSKIASFDMDDTIITRKSGAKFPKNADDWVILFPQVIPTIQKLAKDNYKIVIFTNQMGIQKGHTPAGDIKKKVANIAKEMSVEMQVFVATSEDEYRKPGTKMWEVLEQNNGGIKINKEESFFCGDAAGRKDGKHKDFADTDLKFALNVGTPFKTPENLFLGEVDKIEVKGFNPATVPEVGEVVVNKGNEVKFVDKEMVIFVGSPGSGKSTFWKNYMPKYSRVNRDTLKTKEKCYKVAEEEIKKGNSVIIDNTNPKKEDRKYFIDLAKKHGWKVRCFVFLTPKDICFHNDYQRIANDKRVHLSGKAGSIPIHSFFKYKEEPELNEGFYEINQVNFVAKFDDNNDREFYRKFSKK